MACDMRVLVYSTSICLFELETKPTFMSKVGGELEASMTFGFLYGGRE